MWDEDQEEWGWESGVDKEALDSSQRPGVPCCTVGPTVLTTRSRCMPGEAVGTWH